jgi:hypothetical protein
VAPYIRYTDTFTPGQDIWVAIDPAGVVAAA